MHPRKQSVLVASQPPDNFRGTQPFGHHEIQCEKPLSRARVAELTDRTRSSSNRPDRLEPSLPLHELRAALQQSEHEKNKLVSAFENPNLNLILV
jgi:hypothetical protein